MLRSFFHGVVVAVMCVGLLGCGGGAGKGLNPVKGKITYKGAPVAGATVTFAPSGGQGPSAIGMTNDAGEYTLNTNTLPGAAEGHYKVLVSKYEKTAKTQMSPDDMRKMQMTKEKIEAKSEIPAKYGAPPTTNLEATVTKDASKNVFDFDLKD